MKMCRNAAQRILEGVKGRQVQWNRLASGRRRAKGPIHRNDVFPFNIGGMSRLDASEALDRTLPRRQMHLVEIGREWEN
jgi:hypothetical protein